jgi:hypothetical protein
MSGYTRSTSLLYDDPNNVMLMSPIGL